MNGMKIYNRKIFLSGLFLALIGLGFLFIGFKFGRKWTDWVLISADLLMAGGLIIRSFSKQMSAEDKTNALDERNQLVLLKNASRAFQLAKYGSLILAGFCFIASKVANQESLIFVGSGLMLSFALCLFSDILTFIYYDRKI